MSVSNLSRSVEPGLHTKQTAHTFDALDKLKCLFTTYYQPQLSDQSSFTFTHVTNGLVSRITSNISQFILAQFNSKPLSPISNLLQKVKQVGSVLADTDQGYILMEYSQSNGTYRLGIVNEHGNVQLLETKNQVELETKARTYLQSSISCVYHIDEYPMDNIWGKDGKAFAQFKQRLLDQGLIEESANSISFTDNETFKIITFKGNDRYAQLDLYLKWAYKHGPDANQTEEPSTTGKIMLRITVVTAFVGAVIIPAMSAMERLHVFEHMSNAWNRVQDNLPSQAGLIASSICVMHGQSRELCAVWPMLTFLGKTFAEITVVNPIPNQTAYPNQPFNLDFNAYQIFNQTNPALPLSISATQNNGNALPSWLLFSFPQLEGSFAISYDYAYGVYVVENTAYVAVGSGLQVIDVSNAHSPSLLGSIATSISARGVYVVGNIAYVAGGDLRVIDVSNSHRPSLLGSIVTSEVQGVYVVGNTAYVVGETAGLKIIDVANSHRPSLLGSIATYYAYGVYVVGNMAYVADATAGLKVIDVSNSHSPSLLGSIVTHAAVGVYVVGNTAYVADTFAGLKVIDVSNAHSPSLLGSIATSDASGVYVVENTAYVADQPGGLKVIDVSNAYSPSLLGSIATSNARSVYVVGNIAYLADDTAGLKVIDVATWAFSGMTALSEHAKHYNITVTARNSLDETASTSFILDVYNDGPHVAYPIVNQTVYIGKTFNFTIPVGTFNDPYGDPLKYTSKLVGGGNLPHWLSFNGTTQKFLGFPTIDDVGKSTIEVTATDPYGKNATDDFDLSVLHSNGPIVLHTINNQTVALGHLFDFTIPSNTFNDLDGVILTYTARRVGGADLPDWLSFYGLTQRFLGTPTKVSDLEYSNIEVKVEDPFNKSASTSFYLTTYNTPPVVLHTISDQSIHVGRFFNFTFSENTFFDQDDNPLTYASKLVGEKPLPAWLSFNGPSRRFSGTPKVQADIDTFNIEVEAKDPYEKSVTTDFDLSVINSGPVVAHTLNNRTTEVMHPFDFTVPDNTFDDLDGVSLTYTSNLAGRVLPSWLNFDGITHRFTGTPTVKADLGTLDVVVKAEDPLGKSATTDFYLSIYNKGISCTGTISNQAITASVYFKYTFSEDLFVDNDGADLVYSATLSNGQPLPEWLSLNSATRTFAGTPSDKELGLSSIRLFAKDQCGGEAFTDFDISVIANNHMPPLVNNGIRNQEINIEKLFTMTVSDNAFVDPQNAKLTYSASLQGGKSLPTWLNFVTETKTFSGVPKTTGTLSIVVTATNSYGMSTQATFTLKIVNRIMQALEFGASIGGPIISVLSATFAAYKGRGWLWNKFMKKHYQKEAQTIVLGGAVFTWDITAIPPKEVKEVRVVQNGKNLPGGVVKPDWLKYDFQANTLKVDPTELEPKHIGTWTVRVIGTDKRIREEFDLIIKVLGTSITVLPRTAARIELADVNGDPLKEPLLEVRPGD